VYVYVSALVTRDNSSSSDVPDIIKNCFRLSRNYMLYHIVDALNVVLRG
jgi:hypothetical protein